MERFSIYSGDFHRMYAYFIIIRSKSPKMKPILYSVYVIYICPPLALGHLINSVYFACLAIIQSITLVPLTQTPMPYIHIIQIDNVVYIATWKHNK